VIALKHVLLPANARTFAGERWVNITLRSLHLVGVAGIGGGFFFDLDAARWLPFWYLTLGSGLGLAALYLWGTLAWLGQIKGLAVLVKLLLLALALRVPAWRAELFMLVILLSSVVAHAPGALRGWRPGGGGAGGCH
jgi:hypothetical protein